MPDWGQLWQLTKRTAQAYSADNCSHMAAAISYYVLFSIVPLAILFVSIFGFVVRDDERQEDLANEIVDYLNVEAGVPLIEADAATIDARYGAGTAARVEGDLALLTDAQIEELAADLDRGDDVSVGGLTLGPGELAVLPDNAVFDTIRGVSRASGALTVVGVIGMIGLMWSASAMFGAIRRSLDLAWNVETPRPVVRQKLVDFAMVGGIGALLAASVAGTAALRAFRELSDDALGPLSTGTGPFWSVLPYALPAVLTFVVFLLLYRFVPSVRHSFSEVLPGALLATVLFELLKNLFALYVAKFNNYAGAYGALGGILLFLLWTYLSANILLAGAELAYEYTRMRRGENVAAPGPSRTAAQQVRRFLRGLVFREPEPERAPNPDDTAAQRRSK